ncbi:MAG: DUF3634 family protein [Myxococcales bacterium]|nr:DUF3634 family protein [Myxococcales bacterium]
MGLALFALLMLLTAPLVVAIMRSNELFLVRHDGTRLRIVRGRLPKALLDDLEDVLRRAGTGTLELRAVVEDSRPRLYASTRDLPQPVRQQLRNTLGRFGVAAIRNAPRRR